MSGQRHTNDADGLRAVLLSIKPMWDMPGNAIDNIHRGDLRSHVHQNEFSWTSAKPALRLEVHQ
jgi:hypothetical protein